MFDLNGHVAVITGADSDLGEQFAYALTEQGAHVALLGKDGIRLNKIIRGIGKRKKMAVSVLCDINDASQIAESVNTVLGEFGRVDILVNNCGGNLPANLLCLPREDKQRVININVNSVFTCTHLYIKEMKRLGYGRIVIVSSGLGVVRNEYPAMPMQVSQGVLQSYARAVSYETARYGITVNVIIPGYFRTEITARLSESADCLKDIYKFCPLGRLGEKNELSAAVVYFASEESSYTTGTCLKVDGGWCC